MTSSDLQNYEQPCQIFQNFEFQSHFSVSKIGRIFPKKKICEEYLTKMFKFLNQCFAQLRFWKSVSDSRNLLDGATAVLLETLVQNRSRAKH